MKKLVLALALVAGLGGARSASAAQETIKIKGSGCFETYGNPSYSNQWGVYNNSNDFARLSCPVNLPSRPYTSYLLSVTGWPRSNDPVNPLSCNLTSTNQDGSGVISNNVILPYNPNVSVTGSTSVGAASQNTFVSVSCFIPKTVNFNPSYITSLTVQGFY